MSQTDEFPEATDDAADVLDAPGSAEAPADEPVAEAPAAAEAPEGDVEVLDEDDLLEAPVRQQSAYDRPGRWYVLHSQSGYEN